MSDENVGGWKLVSVEPSQFQIQSIQAQTGCDEATARLFWSKLLYWASEPPADLSAHGQPVVDEALVERAARALDPVAWAVHDGAHPTFKQGTSDHSVKTTLRLASIALTAALEGADHE